MERHFIRTNFNVVQIVGHPRRRLHKYRYRAGPIFYELENTIVKLLCDDETITIYFFCLQIRKDH